MCANNARREWTLDNFEQAYGSTTDAAGDRWIRLLPLREIAANDPALAGADAAGQLHRIPLVGEVE